MYTFPSGQMVCILTRTYNHNILPMQTIRRYFGNPRIHCDMLYCFTGFLCTKKYNFHAKERLETGVKKIIIMHLCFLKKKKCLKMHKNFVLLDFFFPLSLFLSFNYVLNSFLADQSNFSEIPLDGNTTFLFIFFFFFFFCQMLKI